jgi:DNA-binding GntR family transcriptional regulator
MLHTENMKRSPIVRRSLRTDVCYSLREMILEGRWRPGARLNDSTLAAELGVSRTPVLEALIQLEGELLLACDPNRGFFLPPLRRQEAEEIYPILWSLEQLAVFLIGKAAEGFRKRLDETNARFAAASTDPAAALRHDRAWHEALVGASGNARLRQLAGQVEAATRRYAAAFLRDAALHEQRAREHTQIVEALAADQSARAYALLKMHWRAELEAVMRGLEEQRMPAAPDAKDSLPAASGRARAAGAGRA